MRPAMLLRKPAIDQHALHSASCIVIALGREQWRLQAIRSNTLVSSWCLLAIHLLLVRPLGMYRVLRMGSMVSRRTVDLLVLVLRWHAWRHSAGRLHHRVRCSERLHADLCMPALDLRNLQLGLVATRGPRTGQTRAPYPVRHIMSPMIRHLLA